jgi:transcriptional regulator with XRE-family HTH domain
MPEGSDKHIGTVLRKARKRRGMSQRDLAKLSKVSLATIHDLEQGAAVDTRMETARKLAVALQVPTTLLLNRAAIKRDTAVPGDWRSLQLAVETAADQDELPEDPTLKGLVDNARRVRTAYFASRLADLSTMLPSLLRDADALADDPDAVEIGAQLLQIAGSTLTQVHEYTAAETALRRALDGTSDRLRAASIIVTWAWLLVRQGRVGESRELANKWADDLEPRWSRATHDDLTAWGWLLLQSAAASLRDNRPGEAADTMRIARSAAVMTGREVPVGERWLANWGPTTVAYKRAEQYVIVDKPDEALRIAREVASAARPGTEHNRHLLDVARAHQQMRQYGESVEVLTLVHAKSPEWLANQKHAQDTLSRVIEKRRTLTEEMRTLADSIGVPV